MKIAVYAIAKDEEKFAARFYNSVRDADYVCVLDTGSEDRTAAVFRSLGCIVGEKIIDPWRFDVARNESMKLIPADTDVCVCLDIDEILLPGWREALKTQWKPEFIAAHYKCISSRHPDGTPGTSFYREKIHAYGRGTWVYPVHEVMQFPPHNRVVIDGMCAEHHPDGTKSRGQYLPLLELAAEERPDDPRCAHYLGREYMYHGRWDDAVREFRRHLNLPGATWNDERAASWRYISHCLMQQGDKAGARTAALQAIIEQPNMRENWYQAEKCAYSEKDWYQAKFFGAHACSMTERSETSINEAEAWGPEPWDLLAIAYYWLGDLTQAHDAGEKALALDPQNVRLLNNMEWYR